MKTSSLAAFLADRFRRVLTAVFGLMISGFAYYSWGFALFTLLIYLI